MTQNHLKTLKVLGCDGGIEVVLSLMGEKGTWHCPGVEAQQHPLLWVFPWGLLGTRDGKQSKHYKQEPVNTLVSHSSTQPANPHSRIPGCEPLLSLCLGRTGTHNSSDADGADTKFTSAALPEGALGSQMLPHTAESREVPLVPLTLTPHHALQHTNSRAGPSCTLHTPKGPFVSSLALTSMAAALFWKQEYTAHPPAESSSCSLSFFMPCSIFGLMSQFLLNLAFLCPPVNPLERHRNQFL